LVFYDYLGLCLREGNMSDDDVTRQVLTLSDCTVYTGRSCSPCDGKLSGDFFFSFLVQY